MKNRSLQIAFILFTSILFGQSPTEITEHLKRLYGEKPEGATVGYYLYTNDSIKLYSDKVLEKIATKSKFYNFVINERGCYGFSQRGGIATKFGDKLIIQFGLWSISLDNELNPEFVKVFKAMRVKNDADFEDYLNSVAKLLFNTGYETEFEKGSKTKNSQDFNGKYGKLTIEYSNKQITNIKYRYGHN